MRRAKIARWGAAALVLVAAASAWAQDYTATNSSGLIEARPTGATQLNIHTSTTPWSVVVDLPFAFPYYGKTVTTATVCASGFLVAGGTTLTGNYPFSNTAMHGQNTTTGAFPYTQTGYGGPGPQNVDGIITPFWLDWDLGNGTSGTGYAYTWTTGTAPNRHFVVFWENGRPASSPALHVSAQVQLFEGSGRIVFAYSATGAYSNVSYVCGLDSPIDSRFTVPPGVNNATNNSTPRVDVIFDPTVVAVTGTLVYDKLVSDSSGVGNSVLGNRPLGGFPVKLVRPSDGIVFASTTSAQDGAFSLAGVAIPSTSPLSVVVLAQNTACTVSAAVGGAPASWTAASMSFTGDAPLGVVSLGLANDPNGSARSAFNVAIDCAAARDWVASRTTAAIPPLGVVFDDASGAATSYVPAATSPPAAAALYVAGKSSVNPDAWDDGVVTKTYARHVIATIAAPQTTASDCRFDAVTDEQNAFAEAFGCWLWAAVSGSTQVIDGKNATTAAVSDLEHPTVASPAGADVAGRVAGALFDLLDGANEASDPVDGGPTPERVLQLVDAFTTAPTATTFLQAWIDAGYDAQAITRIYVGNGVLADDASEPNDSAAEASPLGAVGVVRRGAVLNRFNEDWYSVALPAAAAALDVDVTYNGLSTGGAVVLEIRDAAGLSTLATGAFLPAAGALHAHAATPAAGTYLLRVAHATDTKIAAYTIQAYVPLSMDAKPVRDWTIGRPYDFTFASADGIGPYSLTMTTGAVPPGLALDAAGLRAHGVPTTVGAYSFSLRFADSGDPANVIIRTETATIHDALAVAVAPFVGFPAGKTVDTALPTAGGTPPFTLSMSSGALTSGLAFAPNSLHVTGTATAGPSSAFELDGVDVAGSADHVATRAVVAVQLAGKKIPADLAAGVDACGWWFDAVEGSTATFAVATAKGRPKRALSGAFLAPDRSLVTTGKIVGRLGAVAASKLVCPQSGRYYFVASSDDAAGAATQLVGTATVALPKSGKGLMKTFKPSDTTTIEFGALPNSTATVKYAGDKQAGLAARVVAVLDPTGTAVAFVEHVKATATGGTLTMQLVAGGTWKVVLGATSLNGNPGKLTYSYALKQGKGVYSAD